LTTPVGSRAPLKPSPRCARRPPGQEARDDATRLGERGRHGGVGQLLGAVAAPRIQRRFTFGEVIITTVRISARTWPLHAPAPHPIVVGIIVAGFMAVIPILDAVQFSYRQALLPDRLQGRVKSAFRMVAFGSQPLGARIGGVLIQAIGPSPPLSSSQSAPSCSPLSPL
jgi:predicted MFS family arabinose efflux permease